MTDGTNMEMVGLLSEGSTLRSIDGVRLARKLDRETFLSEAVRLAFIRVETIYHVVRHALALGSLGHGALCPLGMVHYTLTDDRMWVGRPSGRL